MCDKSDMIMKFDQNLNRIVSPKTSLQGNTYPLTCFFFLFFFDGLVSRQYRKCQVLQQKLLCRNKINVYHFNVSKIRLGDFLNLI